ncbi:MAG: 50S ribosomal protein L18 [Candidatus Portnoybacteria bacterium RIFCSPLOWO2_01_FULL_43_11]|uniref:Large ribosomal subunit protein uL18 n=4 Tax=Candidatus Portnoyibacteriota TaxID=1817913 RepID=A0A1G2FCJ3_9BACT|nr:MAG: 50S ribosomal protein L18 [Candidatus Portnoybacteria bacterium RIFCSPHIGHO2_01_FULL_40_12b]OGZ36189.1 MAG: 50S ribosomal protein L18 [Candidatus Portnoybacteria bacterium RIFCSPHIGHO2_02_FULL_40_23]OGZ38847.1 MAG: 50S ribosomal protein L18 [Candidatus Portnoybacteria bacterium RIFCSPLOWO2_01_FULL_43_11]OGZ39437.1 MAG: 50S ribosomal protein L18 [Candidatus Portnoybacteria bacterium RIFCSPHIGHO2_12_FULL_40_11]OGZ40539.1 MAG: 50S ribosomal protein L18 [Candidatus Portnoybacteria bacterium
MRNKQKKRHRRHKRIRAKTFGTAKRPRFSVFRSNRHIYGQLIDDDKGRTLISVNDLEIKKKSETGKIKTAYETGQLIAKKALEKGIKEVVFDRGGYKYHGRVKAAAEGAREGGLDF